MVISSNATTHKKSLEAAHFTSYRRRHSALGIGANTAIFSAINALLLKPLPFRISIRVVAIWDKLPGRGVMHNETVAVANYLDWQVADAIV
jgi:hypothetical protein